MLSNFTETVSGTLIFIFINAYLFTKTEDVRSVAVFNLGFFITLVFSFYFNAILLKRINLKTVFVPSLVMKGAVTIFLFYIPNLTLNVIFLLGFFYGIFLGFYWANRNFVFPALTSDDDRDYISGLTSFFSNISGVVLPIMAGWFIIWAESQSDFGSEFAYKMIILTGVLILLVGSILLSQISFPEPKITKLFIDFKPRKDWVLLRWFAFLIGAQFVIAITFTEILTLTYLGNEGILGTLMSALAFFVGVVMYLVGRKMKKNDRAKVLLYGNIPLVVFAFFLLFNTSPIFVILYLIVMRIASTTFWFVYFPVLSKAIETQDNGNIEENYAYVLDHEVFINIGRILSVVIFLFMMSRVDQDKGLLVFIFVSAIIQMFALVVGKKLMDLQSSST